jgi:hypothetical protein
LLLLVAMAAGLRAQLFRDPNSAQAIQNLEVSPQPANALTPGSSPLSVQDRTALLKKRNAIRASMAATEVARTASTALPLDNMPPTEIGSAGAFPGNPADLVVGRVGQPDESSNPAFGSSLAEPAGANVGDQWYVAGNFSWAEFSDDGGVTWTDDSPSSIGPPDAPIACCDQDVIVDPASRVFFVETLYINSALNNGVVRIAVHRNPDAGTTCFYDFRSIAGGNVLPDYPHLGLSKRYLWFSTNEIGSSIAGGQQAAMYRWTLDDMENCGTTHGQVFTWNRTVDGQRVWVPAGGTANGETMYWAHNATNGTLRLFRWNEDSGSVFWVNEAVAASNFSSADCRGGANNTNWIDSNQVSIVGFSTRTTVSAIRNDGDEYRHGVLVYWQSGDMAGRPQAFVRGALFRDGAAGFSLFSQPDIFSGGTCFGYHVATANTRGDVGVALAFGGQKGGGGSAVASGVGIADEFTGGNGILASVFFTATGTHNPSDGRFGDYFSVHPNAPCQNWFGATGYALNGGTDVTNVNEVYAEFGRRQSIQCWSGWTGFLPNPSQ